ncbi:transposase [Bifidobacterium breve]|nr:transposase [Bifidobacterium breve]
MPTISAGALKRMPGLPANVVAGVPRVEKDPRGGDVVIVPVRPYARDMDRCARCGERGRPYDRLGVRRCGISTSAAPGSCWSTRPGGSIARSTG